MATQNNYIDRFILLLVFMLMIFGTMVIFSASSMFASQKLGGSNALLNKHLNFIWMGLVVMFFSMKINYKFGNLRFLLSRKEYEGFQIDFHVPSEHAISINL